MPVTRIALHFFNNYSFLRLDSEEEDSEENIILQQMKGN
jgi:hypothetical protein